jgi:hypothetical protein
MATTDQFRTNGTAASFQDWRFDLTDGTQSFGILAGIQEWNWSENVDRGEERANGSPYVQDVTTGEYACESNMVWMREAWDDFHDKLVTRGIGRFSMRGNATCVYKKKNGILVTETITGVMLKKRESSNKQGTEATKVNIDLQIVGRLYLNGKGPFGENL